MARSAADDVLPGLDAYAELVVRVGTNLQRGQLLSVAADVEHAPFVRELTRAAYAAGARDVWVDYDDKHVTREFIANAGDDVLSGTPEWRLRRIQEIADEGGATILVLGDVAPALYDDLDPARVARARPLAALSLVKQHVNERRRAWCVVAYPTPGWAEAVFGDRDVDRLWEAVRRAVRLDEPDPATAWERHLERLEQRAAALTERRFDTLRFRGPGTDLEVGLLPASLWQSGRETTAWGQRHCVNLPTEEVFTTPDHRRASGTVRATRPFDIPVVNAVVRGLELRFEGGRIVEVRADEGEELVRAELEADEGARRLGEVALVDGGSRVGQLGIVFANGLFDENAASHIAYGNAYTTAVMGADALSAEERLAAGINASAVHTDVMIGSDEVEVDGVEAGGSRVAILRGGEWQLG